MNVKPSRCSRWRKYLPSSKRFRVRYTMVITMTPRPLEQCGNIRERHLPAFPDEEDYWCAHIRALKDWCWRYLSGQYMVSTHHPAACLKVHVHFEHPGDEDRFLATWAPYCLETHPALA